MNKQIYTVFAVCVGLLTAGPGFAEPASPSVPQEALLTPLDPKPPQLLRKVIEPPAPENEPVGKIIQDQNARNAFGIACIHDLSVVPLTKDVVEVTVDAPCNRSERIEVAHAGLTFDLQADATGATIFMLPILAVSGVIETKYADGTRLSHTLPKIQQPSYDRVAVEWSDDNTARLSFAEGRTKNQLTHRLGDGSGRVVDVVSRPSTRRGYVKVDRLVISTQITEENCSKDRHGKVRRVLHNQPPVAYDLTIAAPGCARIGTSMVLKNVLQDIILAKD